MPETLRGGEASSNDGGGFQERAAGMVHNVRKWWMANNINAVGRPRGRIHFWAGIDCGQAGNVALNVISQVTLEGNLSSSPSDFTAAVFAFLTRPAAARIVAAHFSLCLASPSAEFCRYPSALRPKYS
jgi:hypothetical protein